MTKEDELEAVNASGLFIGDYKRIFRYIMSMVHDIAEAEDLTQETFLRAFRSYGRVRAGTNYRAWLYKIATNTAHSHWKRRKRSETYTIDLDPEMQAAGVPVIQPAGGHAEVEEPGLHRKPR